MPSSPEKYIVVFVKVLNRNFCQILIAHFLENESLMIKKYRTMHLYIELFNRFYVIWNILRLKCRQRGLTFLLLTLILNVIFRIFGRFLLILAWRYNLILYLLVFYLSVSLVQLILLFHLITAVI